MRFGGLVAVNDFSFQAGRATSPPSSVRTAPARPPCSTASRVSTSRRKALTPLRISGTGSPSPLFFFFSCWSGCPATDQLAGQGRPHVPEHPPVLRHDRSGKPARGAAQPADDQVGLHLFGILGLSAYARRNAKRRVGGAWLEEVRLIDRADDPAGICLTAISAGSRLPAPCARSGAPLPRRTGGGPQPARIVELNQLLASSARITAPPFC